MKEKSIQQTLILLKNKYGIERVVFKKILLVNTIKFYGKAPLNKIKYQSW